MDVKVVFDHKVVLALGVTAVGIIFASETRSDCCQGSVDPGDRRCRGVRIRL